MIFFSLVFLNNERAVVLRNVRAYGHTPLVPKNGGHRGLKRRKGAEYSQKPPVAFFKIILYSHVGA
jgi:hypothetical protein